MKHWTTKEGKQLLITNLSDKHLINIYRMIKRRIGAVNDAMAMLYGAMDSMSGEMAIASFNAPLMELGDEGTVLDYMLYYIKKEIDARKLTV